MTGEMKRWHHDELIHYKKRRHSLILDLITAICISLHFNIQKEKNKLKTLFGSNINWLVATKPLDSLP